jgi:predicted GIY-YIG superfamily endonuclease
MDTCRSSHGLQVTEASEGRGLTAWLMSRLQSHQAFLFSSLAEVTVHGTNLLVALQDISFKSEAKYSEVQLKQRSMKQI